jgi:hypothetical protein
VPDRLVPMMRVISGYVAVIINQPESKNNSDRQSKGESPEREES